MAFQRLLDSSLLGLSQSDFQIANLTRQLVRLSRVLYSFFQFFFGKNQVLLSFRQLPGEMRKQNIESNRVEFAAVVCDIQTQSRAFNFAWRQ